MPSSVEGKAWTKGVSASIMALPSVCGAHLRYTGSLAVNVKAAPVLLKEYPKVIPEYCNHKCEASAEAPAETAVVVL